MNTYQLKLPLVPDVSKTDLGENLATASPKPVAIIPRVVVARYKDYRAPYLCLDAVPDDSAPLVWADAKANGVKTGGFAYILQGKMDEQIQVFIDVCNTYGFYANGKWQLDFPPIADVEVEADPQDYPDAIRGAKWAEQIKQWLDAVEAAFGIRPWIYTAAPQWKWLLINGIAPVWAKDYKFWVKWYPLDGFVDSNVALPQSVLPMGITMDQVVLWQYKDNGRSNGYQYNDLNVPTEAGKEFFGEQPEQDIWVLDLSGYNLFVTPEPPDGIYEINDPLIQAQKYGWDGGMNCGAGFKYLNNTDPDHATLLTAGFQYLMIGGRKVYYSRPMIRDGVINSELSDNPARFPMTLISDSKAYIIKKPLYTEMEAAQYFKARGVQNLYLFDSDRSTMYANYGVLWKAFPDAQPPERVPQCLGWVRKQTSQGGTVKVQAVSDTNIKPMDGSPTTLDTLKAVNHEIAYGDPVYDNNGNLVGIKNVKKVYKSDGVTVDRTLSEDCKVSIGGWVTWTNETEPDSGGGGGTTPTPTAGEIMITVSGSGPAVVSGVDDNGNAWTKTIDGNGVVS